MENKLTIFWIEDNPLQANVERREGKQYPKFLYEEFITYCIFQHPMQVQEYLSLIRRVTRTSNLLAEECQDALPDIVVFDYKMADAFTNNLDALSYYDQDHSSYLKSKSAGHKVKECFTQLLSGQELFLDREDVRRLEYMGDKFKDEINATEIQMDDEFGLYCGISIVREFRDYITVGIPATINKADKTSTMNYNSLFYEWINSYDLKGAIDRPANTSEMKDWSKILKFASSLLRNRIEVQLDSNKITVNIPQLLSYMKGVPTDKNHRIFTLQSNYGTKHFPLDGLFIDYNSSQRDDKIKTWCKKILKSCKSDIYKTAKDTANTLVDAYQAIPVIKNRFRLSRLVVQLCNKTSMTIDETAEMKLLAEEFGIGEDQISSCINNVDAEKSNLTNKVIEYRTLKTSDNLTNRLIVLFTDLKMHKVWQKFCEMNKNSNLDSQTSTLLCSRPGLDDLRAALFPLPKNPLILPYHYHLLSDKEKFNKKDPFEIWDTHLSKSKLKLQALYPKAKYPNGLNGGEIQMCKSFALDISLKQDYFPAWLK